MRLTFSYDGDDVKLVSQQRTVDDRPTFRSNNGLRKVQRVLGRTDERE